MSNPIINDETAVLIVSCAAAIHLQLYLVIDWTHEQVNFLQVLLGNHVAA